MYGGFVVKIQPCSNCEPNFWTVKESKSYKPNKKQHIRATAASNGALSAIPTVKDPLDFFHFRLPPRAALAESNGSTAPSQDLWRAGSPAANHSSHGMLL